MFTGNIRVTAPGHWLFELQTNLASATPGNADITLESSHSWVTRCWLRGRQGIQCASTVHNAWIGWNRFTGRNRATGGTTAAPTAPNVAHLKVLLPASFPSQAAGPHDFYCYRNFFWATPTTAATHPNPVARARRSRLATCSRPAAMSAPCCA